MKYVDVPAILETVDLFGESDLYQTVIMIYFSVLFNYCFFFSNRARFITRSRVRGARKRRCRGGSSGYCCKALGRGCLPAPRGPSPTARLETPPFPSPEEKVRTEKRKEGAHGEGGGEGTPRAVPQCRGSPQFSAYVRGRRARGRGGGGEGHAERSPGWGRLSSRGSTLWSFFGAREGF